MRRHRDFISCLLATAAAFACFAQEAPLRNPFGDPFVRLTNGLPGCPEPEEPLFTPQELSQVAHERSQRGASCWISGQCRLPNGYLYDREIIPRVALAVRAAGGLEDTSVWAIGQRRHVRLRGCVRTAAQSRALEALVLQLDDVQAVDNELMVGTQGPPPYRVRTP